MDRKLVVPRGRRQNGRREGQKPRKNKFKKTSNEILHARLKDGTMGLLSPNYRLHPVTNVDYSVFRAVQQPRKFDPFLHSNTS